MDDRDRAFAEYFTARSDAMRGTAYLLCGDWHRSEDLVQATFTKLYLAWNRVSRHEVLDGYTRRTLVRTFLDERRRGWFRREHMAEPRPGSGSSTGTAQDAVDGSGHPGPEDRLVLLDALASVPPRQRAVLVLRYWEDLSIEETAAVLRCSTGTVKSQAARGLATLRTVLAARDYKEIAP
jgi:RNA polymerase sigma-70 factor (sigma-E family)